MTVMLADYGMGYSEPQTVSFLSGGEIGVKNTTDNTFLDSGTGIGDGDLDIVFFLGQEESLFLQDINVTALDIDNAAIRHGLVGIHDQVLNDLAYLSLVNFHLPEIISNIILTDDRSTTKDKFGGILDDLWDRGGFLDRLASF